MKKSDYHNTYHLFLPIFLLFILVFAFLFSYYILYFEESSQFHNLIETEISNTEHNCNYLEEDEFQKACLTLSRNTLNSFFNGRSLSSIKFPDKFLTPNFGVFVTFEKGVKVRGCRGTLRPSRNNLKEEIIQNTIGAALRDNRFIPLKVSELKDIKISITIVEEMEPLINIEVLQKNEGLAAVFGDKVGVVLPYEGNDPKTRSLWALKKASLDNCEGVNWYILRGSRFKEGVNQ
jgi:AMMECR1 domain-containing protein